MEQKIWSNDAMLQEDLQNIAASEMIDWEKLRGKTVLVTGATGLIGGMFAKGLICASVQRGLDIRVLAAVRNMEKAKQELKSQVAEIAMLAARKIVKTGEMHDTGSNQ